MSPNGWLVWYAEELFILELDGGVTSLLLKENAWLDGGCRSSEAEEGGGKVLCPFFVCGHGVNDGSERSA